MSVTGRFPLRVHALLLVLALLGAPASAATITWNAPATISGDTDVSTAGSLVNAFTFGTSNVTTINGVTFLPFSTSLDTATFPSNYNAYNSSSAPYSGLSSNYQSLLTGGLYGGAETDSITLNNLTVGHTYQVETWVEDSRNCCFGRTETIAGTNSPTLTYNNTSADGGVGQFVTGTFTANATSQTVSYTAGASAQVNGLELRDLTAPAVSHVTWSAPTPITTADATIGNALHIGPVVYATGWGNGGPETVTLTSGQHIVFQNGTIGSPMSGNANYSGGSSGNNVFFTGGGNTTGNSVLNTVLDSAVFNGGKLNTLTLTGLTAGQQYEVQLFADDTRGCCTGREVVFQGQGDGQLSSQFTEGAADYILGKFTATGSTQTIYEYLPTGGQGNMNALVLYAVAPEPSSCGLFAVGIFGLVAAAHRRRKR